MKLRMILSLSSAIALAGSLVRVAGTTRLYDLKLTGVHPSALYFADRPYRLVGSVPLSRMLAGFFAKPGKTVPPNAAINAVDPRSGDQLLMGAALLSAKYAVKAATLTYRVRTLPQGARDQQERGRTDVILPRTLAQTTVFIDDSYRYCSVDLANSTDAMGVVSSQWLYTHDDWTTAPKDARVGNDPVAPAGQLFPSTNLTWGSESGFDRGCSNSVTFTLGSLGTVTIAVADPWSGSNSYSCTFTGVPGVECLKMATGYWNPVWGGDSLSAQYELCLDKKYFPANPHVDCDTNVAQGFLLR